MRRGLTRSLTSFPLHICFFSCGLSCVMTSSLLTFHLLTKSLGPIFKYLRTENLIGPAWSWEQLRLDELKQGAGSPSTPQGCGQFH